MLMPYIPQEFRPALDRAIEQLVATLREETARDRKGHANYVITQILRKTFGNPESYSSWADAIGTLECAKLELYRRYVVPYENGAIARNGDVT
jgi:hypothetical protein